MMGDRLIRYTRKFALIGLHPSNMQTGYRLPQTNVRAIIKLSETHVAASPILSR